MNPRLLLIGAFLVIFLLIGGSQKEFNQIMSLIEAPTPTTKPSQTLGTIDKTSYLVTKIIDGDTIEIEGGQKVRYIGIDTPELRNNECFAEEARDKNKELLEGKRVKLQKDVSETDRYGRLLRYVYTESNDFINERLVLEGYATSATFPPDVAKQEIFQNAQKEAIAQNRGLWKIGCK